MKMNRRHLIFGAAAAVATIANASPLYLLESEPTYRIRYVRQYPIGDNFPAHRYDGLGLDADGGEHQFACFLQDHDSIEARYRIQAALDHYGFTPIDPAQAKDLYFKLELPRGVHAEYI